MGGLGSDSLSDRAPSALRFAACSDSTSAVGTSIIVGSLPHQMRPARHPGRSWAAWKMVGNALPLLAGHGLMPASSSGIPAGETIKRPLSTAVSAVLTPELVIECLTPEGMPPPVSGRNHHAAQSVGAMATRTALDSATPGPDLTTCASSLAKLRPQGSKPRLAVRRNGSGA